MCRKQAKKRAQHAGCIPPAELITRQLPCSVMMKCSHTRQTFLKLL